MNFKDKFQVKVIRVISILRQEALIFMIFFIFAQEK